MPVPSLPARLLPKVLLGYIMECQLASQPPPAAGLRVSSPWDAWWACYRAALPLGRTGAQITLPRRACPACVHDATGLAAASPPGHPGTSLPRPCGCVLKWAVRLRAPGTRIRWPPLSLTLALLKPGAPGARIGDLLAPAHDVLQRTTLMLTTEGTRRLYPEAYGASYVAARDAYLTSAPVTVLVLRARDQAVTAWRVKAQIRDRLGGDALRNHLHMPDNPGEALADIAQFAGQQALAELYERHERERAALRLAFYRAALGIGPPGADRRAC
jgi:hypothetical protein